MDPIDPDLALAFTSIAAVGSSMVRSFRIDEAKACTRLCRRILTFAAAPPPSDLAGVVRAFTGVDNLLAALGLLTRRLDPLGTIDSARLRTADAAITSLRHRGLRLNGQPSAGLSSPGNGRAPLDKLQESAPDLGALSSPMGLTGKAENSR